MQKSWIAVLLACALGGLAGCNNTSSPTAVMMTAAKNLRDNNFKRFRSTLTGDALTQYGNLAGAAQLQNVLTQDAVIGQVDLLTRVDDASRAESHTTHRVQVLSGTRTLLNATVACVTYYQMVPCAMINRSYCQPDPAYNGYYCYGPIYGATQPSELWCSEDSFEGMHEIQSTDCRISRIDLN